MCRFTSIMWEISNPLRRDILTLWITTVPLSRLLLIAIARGIRLKGRIQWLAQYLNKPIYNMLCACLNITMIGSDITGTARQSSEAHTEVNMLT